MKSKLGKAFLAAWTVLLLFGQPTLAMANTVNGTRTDDGVGGIGNTGDITIQLDLAKELAIQLLKNVSGFDLYDQVGRSPQQKLYHVCRAAMYKGTVLTEFEIVPSIPESGGLNAIAQRVGTKIRISRHEYERMSRLGQIDMPFLVTLVLQEVGHDCEYNGSPVDDSFDPLLNQLAIDLYKASSRTRFGSLKDLEFIEQIRNGNGESMQIDMLSPATLAILVNAYLNYIGDWTYERYKNRFHFRPAPASDYFATHETSVYSGWHQLHEALPYSNEEINALVYGLLRATFEEKAFFVYQDFRRTVLPSRVKCSIVRNELENIDVAKCKLKVYWTELPVASLRGFVPRIRFEVDALGRTRISQIGIKVESEWVD